MLDIPKIQAVCRKASHWDLYGSSFGGSYVHMHLFRPVVDVEELEIWEELMGFTLPEDYRSYLTCLGNGGAGPYYGVLPFSFLLRDEYQKEAVYTSSQAQQFHHLAKRRYEYEFQDTSALYKDYCRHTPEAEQLNSDQFEKIFLEKEMQEVYESLYEHGLLRIGDSGCSGDIGLLLNGSHRGYVGGIRQEGYFSNLAPDFSLAEEMNHWEPFADYLMAYVQQAQEFCNHLPAAQKRQALQERETVLSFQTAIERQDWKEILYLLRTTNPKALSEKTTFFFQYYEKALQRELPEEPLVTGFYQEIEKSRRWNYERYHGFYDEGKKKVMRDNYEAHIGYAVPTFQQFFQTFVEMTEDI